MRKLISFLLLIFLTVQTLYIYAVGVDMPIEIKFNGKTVRFEKAPVMENDRALVPMRRVLEKMGADVYWDNETKTATAIKYPYSVSVSIDNIVARKNNEEFVLDVPARLINDVTYVPLRFVAEGLNCGVLYDNGVVNITYEIKRGNTNGNIINNGHAAFEGEYLYASAYYGTGLWKINIKSGEQQKIFDYNASCINVLDGWIYCYAYKNDGKYKNMGIYRLKTDGSSMERICDMQLSNLLVANNKIYGHTFNDSLIYSMNLDGSELEKMSDYGYEDLNIDENYLYARNSSVYRIDLDTITSETIEAVSTFTSPFIIDDGWLYYIYEKPIDGKYQKYLYKKRADGSGETVRLIKDAYNFNVQGEYIYYYKLMEPGLFKAKIDGADLGKISDDHVGYIYVFGDYVYYCDYTDFGITRLKNDGSDKKIFILNEKM